MIELFVRWKNVCNGYCIPQIGLINQNKAQEENEEDEENKDEDKEEEGKESIWQWNP